MNPIILHRTHWVIWDGFLPNRIVLCERPGAYHPFVVWNQVGSDDMSASQLKYSFDHHGLSFDRGDYFKTKEEAMVRFNERVKAWGNNTIYTGVRSEAFGYE